jgi:PAS domain S-box-containing protein
VTVDAVRLRAIVDSLPVGVVVVDRAGVVVFTSAVAAELVGGGPGGGVDRRVIDLVHPDDREFAAVALANTTSRAGLAPPLRLRLAPPLGHRMVEVQGNNLLDDPAVGGVVFTVRLVDDEQVLTASEASERRYQVMLDNISDSVTLTDANRQVVALTGRQETLGYALDFWTKFSARSLIHPDDVHLYDAFLDELRHSRGETVRTRYRIQHADGRWITQAVDSVNLLDDDDVRAIVTTTRDVTAEVEAATALAEAHRRSVDALAARDELVASVSHELRTPIHGILGLTELLAISPLREQEQELVASIASATESLRLVLDDLLDFSKIEAGHLELASEPFSPVDVLRDLGVLFGPLAATRGLRFEIDVDDRLPAAVRGDSLRFRQVLQNLVGNAVKFTSVGEVRIGVRVEHPGGHLSALVLHVEVADTGIGVAPDDLERVFEPFTEASAGRSGGIRGTGLGLAIARRLVALLGGTLRLESTLGRGSVFSFDMPVEPVEIPGLPPTASVRAERSAALVADGWPQARVLVVEDNQVNQLLVTRQLERLGVDAVVVGDGLTALDVLANNTFHVILLDWQLPGIDGFEVARRLRELEARTDRHRTPIVALTASAFVDEEHHLTAAGMDGFVTKPADLSALHEALSAVLTPATSASPYVSDAVQTESNPVVGSLDAPSDIARAVALEPGDMVDAPGIDRHRLAELVAEVDDDRLVASVLSTYGAELEPRRQQLLSAAHNNDLDGVRRVAHTLASSSAMVGATTLAERCRSLEVTRAVSTDDLAAFGRAVDEVVADLPVALAEVEDPSGQSSAPKR